jgi:hypothetical protein
MSFPPLMLPTRYPTAVAHSQAIELQGLLPDRPVIINHKPGR